MANVQYFLDTRERMTVNFRAFCHNKHCIICVYFITRKLTLDFLFCWFSWHAFSFISEIQQMLKQNTGHYPIKKALPTLKSRPWRVFIPSCPINSSPHNIHCVRFSQMAGVSAHHPNSRANSRVCH